MNNNPAPPANQAPSASITSPAAGSTFTQGNAIAFAGSATDPEDGGLSGSALVWVSTSDGTIGTGASFSRSDLSVGNHTVTLTATDGQGATANTTVSFVVVSAPPQPGWNAMGATAFPETARQVAIAADGSQLFAFFGWSQPSLPTLEQARIEEWNGSGWVAAPWRTNDGDRFFEATAQGGDGAITWNDQSLRFGRGEKQQGGSWAGFVISSLSQRTRPSVAFAFGVPFHGYVEQGRAYVSTPLSTTLPELNGGLGQEFNTCGLTNDCIRRISMAGDNQGWYMAVSEAAGCISVKRGYQNAGTNQSAWLGPCFVVNGGAGSPQAAVLNGQPVVAFFEDGGTSFYVAQWDGAQWTLIGQATVTAATQVDIVSDGTELYVLTVDTQASSQRITVSQYDNGNWPVLPGSIESSATSTISTVADIAVFEGQPVVAFVENGQVGITRYVPGLAPKVGAARGVISGGRLDRVSAYRN